MSFGKKKEKSEKENAGTHLRASRQNKFMRL